MDRFHVLDEAAVIVRRKGVFRQAKVFVRGNAIYAGYFGGFVRLYANGGTGMPDLSWDDIDLGNEKTPFQDAHGKLLLERPKLKSLTA